MITNLVEKLRLCPLSDGWHSCVQSHYFVSYEQVKTYVGQIFMFRFSLEFDKYLSEKRRIWNCCFDHLSIHGKSLVVFRQSTEIYIFFFILVVGCLISLLPSIGFWIYRTEILYRCLLKVGIDFHSSKTFVVFYENKGTTNFDLYH